jgi:hypothetical protein
MFFAMPGDATVGRLKERVVDWMTQRGQGEDWTIEGEDREEIDFEYEYQVIPIEREVPIRIFLKQTEMEVLPSMSWINLSDQPVRNMQLPPGTLFRIYPVDGPAVNQDAEDHSYTIDWEEGKQYSFEIVYDISKDRNGQSREIKMADFSGRVDTFVIPRAAEVQEVANMWKKMLEKRDDIGMRVTSGNGEEFFWGYETAKDMVTYTFRAPNFHGDARVFGGTTHFEADQISRLLDFKMPPFAKCQLTPRKGGAFIQFDGDVTPLGLKILRQHLLSWNIEGRILKAPQVTTWWVPYHLDAIMRYGRSVNTAIPEDPNEAEFPPTPWPDEVIIRVKSQASPGSPAALLSVDGSPGPSAPDSPSAWKGPALGQAPPISADAAGLADYTSPYSARTVEGQQGESTDEELLRLRGETKINDEVHMIISWTTREDYPLWIGISLPIQNPDGFECHEGQLWEEADEQRIISENHAEYVYTWLQNRLAIRSSIRNLPEGMPNTVEEVTAVTRKDGKAGYILFTPNYSLAVPMKKMDVQAVIEYDSGYMKVGMGEAYTVRILAQEFWELTQRHWQFYPIYGYRRWTDGSVVHRITWELREYQAVVADDSMAIRPAKISEERGRGTVVLNQASQGKLLQYWAWSQLPVEVGVCFPETKRNIEYWMVIPLQPVPDDNDPTIYLRVFKELWMDRLREISNGVAQNLETLGDDFAIQVRYLYNCLRIWFVPLLSVGDVKRPLAEEPCPKDKWYSWTDLMAVTFPTQPDDQIEEEPSILFGPGCSLQERYADVEVQGGKIALIAFKQMGAQKQPNGLDRMQPVSLKQVAYDQRVIEAEENVAGISTDVADFLLEMSFEPEDTLVICVSGSEEMKRNEEAIAGQLSMQGDRQMTASNKVAEGMVNSRESAILTAAGEAVTWRHITEPEGLEKVNGS